MTVQAPRGDTPYRGRFAPSPTGALHFGSLVAALGSWLRARAEGGTWLVRTEDLDPPREVPGAAEAILETLSRFGMASDEFVVRQRDRHAAYAQALARLQASGDVFPCTCSRASLDADGGIHRRACEPDPARPPAWRVRVPDGTTITFDDAVQGPQTQDVAREVGDFVVVRADGLYAYQLAVVVDDAAQAITEIVRGADLLDSTPRQILLQRRLGLPTPAYAHLPLATDANGAKLSKQSASLPVDPAAPMPALVAALRFLGQDSTALDDLRTPDALLALAAARFRLDCVPRRAPFVP